MEMYAAGCVGGVSKLLRHPLTSIGKPIKVATNDHLDLNLGEEMKLLIIVFECF
jgi:hypothetical protein